MKRKCKNKRNGGEGYARVRMRSQSIQAPLFGN